MNLKLPDKIFKKGDILVLNDEAKRWDWSNDNVFICISHHLYYKDDSDGVEPEKLDITVPYSKLNGHVFPKKYHIQRWLLSVKDVETGKYYRYAEKFMEYNKVEMRNKKIDELIK